MQNFEFQYFFFIFIFFLFLFLIFFFFGGGGGVRKSDFLGIMWIILGVTSKLGVMGYFLVFCGET